MFEQTACRVLPMTLIAALGLTPLAHATQNARVQTNSGDASIVAQPGWASPLLARSAASSGRALLDHLASARGFLATGGMDGARDALITAREFADALERTMPFLTVSDDIRNARGKLVAGETNLYFDDMLPIYASLDRMDVYAPALATHTRARLKQAESQTRAGQSERSALTLKEVADEVERTTVYLPLDFVSKQVRIALSAIDAKPSDVARAQTAVGAALGSLHAVVVDNVTLPTASAR